MDPDQEHIAYYDAQELKDKQEIARLKEITDEFEHELSTTGKLKFGSGWTLSELATEEPQELQRLVTAIVTDAPVLRQLDAMEEYRALVRDRIRDFARRAAEIKLERESENADRNICTRNGRSNFYAEA